MHQFLSFLFLFNLVRFYIQLILVKNNKKLYKKMIYLMIFKERWLLLELQNFTNSFNNKYN